MAMFCVARVPLVDITILANLDRKLAITLSMVSVLFFSVLDKGNARAEGRHGQRASQ